MDLQGTVRRFDAVDRSGTAVLDDGRTLTFDAAAFDAGGLRLLRPGQRVRLRVSDDAVPGRVMAVTLSTFLFADDPRSP